MQSALEELDNDKDTLFLWKRVLGAENSQPRCADDHEHGGTELLDGVLVDRLSGCRMSSPKITRITNDLTTPQLGKLFIDFKMLNQVLGKPLLLRCISEGVPRPRVEWKAPNGDLYKISVDDFEGVIVHFDGTLNLLDGMKNMDLGEYTCIGMKLNNFGL